MTDPSLALARQVLEGFGADVRRARKALTLSTRELEELLGIRADVINRVETGRWMPTPEHEAQLREWMLQRSDS